MSIATRNSKNDAHQKHEPHNKKSVSLHIFITFWQIHPQAGEQIKLVDEFDCK
jgi:hypothetical protein